jgi:hypothetical protein
VVTIRRIVLVALLRWLLLLFMKENELWRIPFGAAIAPRLVRHHLGVIRAGLRHGLVFAAATAFLGAACGSRPSPAPVASAPGATLTASASASRSTSLASVAVSPQPSVAVTGFGFDPESIVGYYQSIGYACRPRQPSATAAGYEYQSCELVDAAGRTTTIGIVTDPADSVADAVVHVRGSAGETVLDPNDVLEPFSRFLGAFLGEARGTALLPWLAAHLGDPDARTTLGALSIATFTDSPEDHATLSVEIATQGFLDAPAPSGASPASP